MDLQNSGTEPTAASGLPSTADTADFILPKRKVYDKIELVC